MDESMLAAYAARHRQALSLGVPLVGALWRSSSPAVLAPGGGMSSLQASRPCPSSCLGFRLGMRFFGIV
jgi:hypothetical protein